MNSRKSTDIGRIGCQLGTGTTNYLLYSLVYLSLISDDQNSSKICSAWWKIYAGSDFDDLFDACFDVLVVKCRRWQLLWLGSDFVRMSRNYGDTLVVIVIPSECNRCNV